MNAALIALFVSRFGEEPHVVAALKPHASNRQIFRLTSANHSAIGIVNAVERENNAFVEFTNHFHSCGLNVPEIYAHDLEHGIYLEQDLGDETLYDILIREREQSVADGNKGFSESVEALYQKVIKQLPRFQIEAGRSLNYDHCYPVSRYDRAAMVWDMRFFRDNFLRRTETEWSHHSLEADFEKFADFLAQAPSDFFMYRDFQSRNIMVQNGEVYFIDYQGGRLGPLQYDMASLLYQSRANVPADARQRLLKLYLDEAQGYAPINREEFLRYFHGFVFIRLMQVLGTYGDKGLGEKREYFLKSIPFAIANLRSLIETTPLPFNMPALTGVFNSLITNYAQDGERTSIHPVLKLNIFSFSYRTGLPRQSTDHGGGFIFDCRCLPNPGRIARYRDQTGLDDEVIAYFRERSELEQFIVHVSSLVDQAIENYIARGFVSLSVGFGCTGGQHRSVYCTEMLAKHVREKFNIEASREHIQLRLGILGRPGRESGGL